MKISSPSRSNPERAIVDHRGRGTTGGALNIVTKEANSDKSFYKAKTTIAGDATRRVTLDVNQVISPTLAVRVDGMWQNANVAERDYTFDDRWGGLAAVKWTPTGTITVTANYVHTDLIRCRTSACRTTMSRALR